jgi:hypothetical protein
MRRLAALLAVVALAACHGGHHHGPITHFDPDKLFVEVYADGGNEDALRDGAARGLSRVPFVVRVPDGGELELQVEVSMLSTIQGQTRCGVKILANRLPQHDLLGIADGSARAAGTDRRAASDCLSSLATTLIGGKVRTLLHKRLEAKR